MQHNRFLLLSVFLILNACVGIKKKDLDLTRQRPEEISSKQEESTGNKEDSVREEENLGVLLGPGYLKSYAHLGVLKQIDNRSIPVKAVAGIGWGAVVGAAYSKTGRASESEWQMFKLDKEKLAGKALFTGKVASQKMEELDSFFDELYKNSRIEQSKIAFACPTYSLQNFHSRMIEDGPYKLAVKYCVGGNSFFDSYRANLWDPFAVEQAIAFLRAKGASKILVVDVLSEGEFSPRKLKLSSEQEYYIWAKANDFLKEKAKKVDYTIQINTSSASIHDEAKRREFLRAGEEQSQKVLDQISQDILGR